jgi:hypothetical protein
MVKLSVRCKKTFPHVVSTPREAGGLHHLEFGTWSASVLDANNHESGLWIPGSHVGPRLRGAIGAPRNDGGEKGSIRLPDGQISDGSCFCLSSPLRKNISVFPKYKSGYMIRHPVPREGRWPSSRTLGRDAVDAAVPRAQA